MGAHKCLLGASIDRTEQIAASVINEWTQVAHDPIPYYQGAVDSVALLSLIQPPAGKPWQIFDLRNLRPAGSWRAVRKCLALPGKEPSNKNRLPSDFSVGG